MGVTITDTTWCLQNDPAYTRTLRQQSVVPNDLSKTAVIVALSTIERQQILRRHVKTKICKFMWVFVNNIDVNSEIFW